MSDREMQLNRALEAMHFGYRAMIEKPDQRLAELDLGRVHHRLLYFIGRHPDCSINELLNIMRVSKQYLHKPLKRMVELGYVRQQPDRADRRIRRLKLTPTGRRLEHSLSELQRRRFAEIFAAAGSGAERHWHRVMHLLGESLDHDST